MRNVQTNDITHGRATKGHNDQHERKTQLKTHTDEQRTQYENNYRPNYGNHERPK